MEIEIGGKSAHTAQRDKGINAINEIVSFVKELECFLQQRDTYGLTSLVNLTGIY
ncbi:MAG: peptidase dimerization domain-containing protein [Candidatus Peribacteria bacterium]|nr:peptidase dimerization domain-containing protein [Candidatus Peribacteria bacterium]